MNLFVTGTDTGVGKTVVSAILCLKFKYKYWKPIQCGIEDGTDSAWVARRIGSDAVCSEAYRLKNPLSPHTAAAKEGIEIDEEMIVKMTSSINGTIIEGAGGLLVPLNEKTVFLDLIKKLRTQVLLVARSGLGTLNHSLLSIEALRARGIEPLGIVMVGELNPTNKNSLENYGKVKVLGEIPPLLDLSREVLIQIGPSIQIKKENEWKHSMS